MLFTIDVSDFDRFALVAGARGIEPFELLRAIADLGVSTTSNPQAPKPEPAPEPKPAPSFRDPSSPAEMIDGFVLAMAENDRVDALTLCMRLTGSVPEGRGARRVFSNYLEQHRGLEGLRNSDGHRFQKDTDWGRSPIFRRIPMVTGPKKG